MSSGLWQCSDWLLSTKISEEYTASIFVAEVEVAYSCETLEATLMTTCYQNPELNTVKTLKLTFTFTA